MKPLAELEALARDKFAVGAVHGWLTIIARASRKPGVHWLVRCRCGTEKVVRQSNMTRDTRATVSCGCYAKQIDRPWAKTANLKHGHTVRANGAKETPEYKTWQNMRRRCEDPTNRHYKNYGGRGITVCERWQSFESFLADMGERTPGTSIERKDNNLGYEPSNCCWATTAEQSRNKRTTKLSIEAVAKVRRLRSLGIGPTELARRFGVTRTTIQRTVNGRQTRKSEMRRLGGE